MISFRRALGPVAAVETIGIPVLVAAATFAAAEPWLRVFSVTGTLPLVIAAAVLPVVIATVVIRIGRQPPPVSYVLSAVGLLLLLLLANGLHPSAIGHGLRAGPNQVLTETLPLGGNRGLLTAPILLIWLGGAASTELIVRSRRTSTGLAAVGLSIPIGAYVVAYAVSASRPGSDNIGAPILLVLLVLIAVLRHGTRLATTTAAGVGSTIEAESRPSSWRPGAVGLVAAAATIAVLAATFPSLPALEHKPATLSRTAPLARATVVDPVDALASLRDNDPLGSAVPELRVSTGGATTGYLAMAILDNYDGALWSFNATFQPTGGRVPTLSGQSAGVISQQSVRQHETLLAPLVLPLLPALDRPVSVSGVATAADATTGMVAPSRPLGVGASYTVVSTAPAMTLADVPPADGIDHTVVPGPGVPTTATASDLALPADSTSDLATVLKLLSQLTNERPAATVAFLQAVVSALHTDERRIDPTLPIPRTPAPKKHSGKKGPPATTTTTIPPPDLSAAGATSLSEVINAISFSRTATPEQFATTLAMVARYLGVPARLVTGYRVAPNSTGASVPAGTYQVTNRQAWAWVEIPISGLGWVVVDPTPDSRSPTTVAPPVAASATATTLPPPQANAVPESELGGGHALAKPSTVKTPISHPTPWWVETLAGLGGAVALALLLGPVQAEVRRLRRRRARCSSDPAHLAVGAWLEVLDGLQQAGMVAGPGATGAEVAAEAALHFGPDVADPVREVALVADQAMCCTVPPELPVAEGAWQSSRSIRRAVYRGLDRRQRSRSLFVVGSAPSRPGR